MEIKKVNFIIRNFKPKKIKLIFLLSIIIAFLEILGLGMLIPLTQKILDTSDITKNDLLHFIYILKFEYLLITVFIVYLIKNSLIFIINSYLNQFISKFRSFLSIKIFSNILKKDLNFHLNQNTSEFIHASIDDPNIFVSYVLKSYIQIISEFFILSFIVFFLILIEPTGSMITFLIFFLFIIIYILLSRKYSQRLGDIKRTNDERRLFSLKEAYNSVKEIKFFKIEDYIIKNFSKFNDASSRSFRRHSTITILPKLYFEVVAIILILLLVYYTKTNFYIGNELIFKFAIFGVATVKIIPSLNKISTLYQNIKYGETVTLKIYNYIKSNSLFELEKKSLNNKLLNFENLKFEKLQAQNLSFAFNDNLKPIFENLNFTIKKKQSIRIAGTIGSGKSTLINVLVGLLKPTSGEIYLNDKPMHVSQIELNKIIGYVPQSIYILNDTIENNILFGRDKISDHEKHLNNLVKMFEFTEVLKKNFIHENGRNLSGGQRQILGFIRALYNHPKILIIDEATNSLDETSENKIFNILKKNFFDITIIGVTHDPKVQSKFDDVIDLK